MNSVPGTLLTSMHSRTIPRATAVIGQAVAVDSLVVPVECASERCVNSQNKIQQLEGANLRAFGKVVTWCSYTALRI